MNYNDLFKIMEDRRSIRSYIDKEVSDADIENILLAGIQAPSGTNVQGWKFRIIKDKKNIEEISSVIKEKVLASSKTLGEGIMKQSFLEYAKNFYFFKNAPVLLALYAKNPNIIINNFFKENSNVAGGVFQSLGMVMQNIMLAAHSLGLGTCTLNGPFIALNEIERIIITPKHYKFGGFICLGYPKMTPKSPGRMELNKFIIKDKD